MASSGSKNTNPTKITAKRLVSYKKTWEQIYPWLRSVNNVHKAMCKLCSAEFSISHSGVGDIKTHMKRAKHLSRVEEKASNSTIQSRFTISKEKTTKSISEATFAYHTVKHSHSYNSVSCSAQLFKDLFPDSHIAKTFTCSRTKCTKIVVNVIAPALKKKLKEDLNGIAFSIATDASNRGNVKTFPFVVRYFIPKTGICVKLLKFYSLTSETSVSIAGSLKSILLSENLPLNKVSSYSADNASVNFGIRQSVFTELHKENPDILPRGCMCHILHNTMKKAQSSLRFDIEAIVIMSFNEFSSSTKNVTKLKDLVSWCGEEEWSELLRHVPTRWLSLIPAVERLLKHFEAVKAYFTDKDNARNYVRKFFESELAEAYLGFLLNVGTIFQNAVTKLESIDSTILDMYNMLNNIHASLKTKLEEQFYGSIALQVLHKCEDSNLKKRFKREAQTFLEIAVKYLEEHYDFDNNFKLLLPLNLERNPTFNEITEIVNNFNIKDIDIDMLFEEIALLKKYLQKQTENISYLEKWVAFFKLNNAQNLQKICQFAFSLPASNAMCERVFSLMTSAWRKERNSLSIDTLEAELFLKINCDYSCKNFCKFLKEDPFGQAIISEISSSDKYT